MRTIASLIVLMLTPILAGQINPPGTKPFPLGPNAKPIQIGPNAMPVSTEPASQPSEIIPPARLARLIADLGSPDWTTRENATEELSDGGEAIYPDLKQAFNRSGSYEIKRRIRAIAEQIYFYRVTTTRGGFLGIQHQAMGHDSDPRIPEGEVWIRINTVVAGSAAQRAGLQPNDYITELEGRRLKINDPFAFADWIGKQRPGTAVRLGVMRWQDTPVGRIESPMELRAVLGRRKLENLNVFGPIPREQKMVDARNRFAGWWRQEFDPKGEVDEQTPVRNDPEWTLEPRGTGK